MASGPSVPNPQTVSNAQTQSNQQTAVAQTGLNSTNQKTPFGDLNYSQIGTWPDGTPRFQAETTLNPQLQGIFNTGLGTQQQIGNTAQGLAGGLQGQLQQPNQPQYQNYGSAPQLQGSPVGDFNSVRQQTLDTLNSELNSQSDRDLGSLNQKLANQGIQSGGEAYRNAMGDFGKQVSANRTNAILAANTAQGQAQDLALSNANFGNAATQQNFSNQNQVQQQNNALGDQRFQNQQTSNNQNINQLLALLGGSQIQQPQFGSTPQTAVQGTDVTGNTWNAYNAQQGQSNQFWNGVGALGGTAAGFLFSDRRLKEDISDTGMKTPGGVPIRNWRYKGSPMMQTGYIAQEVQKKQPDAVRKGPGGFLMVAPDRVA